MSDEGSRVLAMVRARMEDADHEHDRLVLALLMRIDDPPEAFMSYFEATGLMDMRLWPLHLAGDSAVS